MSDEESSERVQQIREKTVASQNARRTHSPLPRKFDFPVVGVTFVPHYPDNIMALEEVLMDAEMKGEQIACIIVRNPDNKFDTNACEVHIPALGGQGFVGHIAAALAARLAPVLDAGVRFDGHVSHLRVHQDHLDRPGLQITLEEL